MINNFKFKLVSSLEKVFPKTEPRGLKNNTILSGLFGEVLSFQLAYTVNYEGIDLTDNMISISVNSSLKVNMSKVGLVPSSLPTYGIHDDNYITTAPGMFPDVLLEMEDTKVKAIPGQWRALWFDVEIQEGMQEGEYPVEIEVRDKLSNCLYKEDISLKIIEVKLPEQRLIHTEWFHADCLADYYKVPVLSERHWEIIDNFIHTATKCGVNMLLTPIFTLPLDTLVGGERTTLQLVDIEIKEGNYIFGFENLRRWIKMAQKQGIKYFEISHLFTQWGAKSTPKIMATIEGKQKRIGGWDFEATSEMYKTFIAAFLPQLIKFLTEMGVEKNTYFHVSDEPHSCNIETYKAAKEVVEKYLEDFTIIDALSSYEIYEKGVVENPIVCNDHIETFIHKGVESLWTYNCCAQAIDVSNRFMAMPSARNRILGIQMYKYKIEGYLHWGYNFYNSQHSTEHINPYVVTDAGEAFPSGDPFLVYPGEDGTATQSIRFKVLAEALYDLRAFQLLESLTNREHVIELIEEDLQEPITFKEYPWDEKYIWETREKVNRDINKYSKGTFVN